MENNAKNSISSSNGGKVEVWNLCSSQCTACLEGEYQNCFCDSLESSKESDTSLVDQSTSKDATKNLLENNTTNTKNSTDSRTTKNTLDGLARSHSTRSTKRTSTNNIISKNDTRTTTKNSTPKTVTNAIKNSTLRNSTKSSQAKTTNTSLDKSTPKKSGKRNSTVRNAKDPVKGPLNSSIRRSSSDRIKKNSSEDNSTKALAKRSVTNKTKNTSKTSVDKSTEKRAKNSVKTTKETATNNPEKNAEDSKKNAEAVCSAEKNSVNKLPPQNSIDDLKLTLQEDFVDRTNINPVASYVNNQTKSHAEDSLDDKTKELLKNTVIIDNNNIENFIDINTNELRAPVRRVISEDSLEDSYRGSQSSCRSRIHSTCSSTDSVTGEYIFDNEFQNFHNGNESSFLPSLTNWDAIDSVLSDELLPEEPPTLTSSRVQHRGIELNMKMVYVDSESDKESTPDVEIYYEDEKEFLDRRKQCGSCSSERNIESRDSGYVTNDMYDIEIEHVTDRRRRRSFDTPEQSSRLLATLRLHEEYEEKHKRELQEKKERENNYRNKLREKSVEELRILKENLEVRIAEVNIELLQHLTLRDDLNAQHQALAMNADDITKASEEHSKSPLPPPENSLEEKKAKRRSIIFWR